MTRAALRNAGIVLAALLQLVTAEHPAPHSGCPFHAGRSKRSPAIQPSIFDQTSSFFNTFPLRPQSVGNNFFPFPSEFSNKPTTGSLTFAQGQGIPNLFGGGGAGQAAPLNCSDLFVGRCDNSRYRTFDGSCNNRQNPNWGMANTRYGRLLPFNYADGVHQPTKSVTGNDLPLSRDVSYVLHPDKPVNDKKFTLAAMQYGQIITHDMALIQGSTQTNIHPATCCTDDGQYIPEALDSPLCYPIVISRHDPLYGHTNRQCMNFVRSITDLDQGCSTKFEPAEQLTVVSHFLDLSEVYGSSTQVARSIRSGFRGRLTTDIRYGREWPPQAINKTAACAAQAANEVCYLAGDPRVNQNPQLTILQILLLREHNRVAEALTQLNPHWSDETTYQEARRIVIAEHQHISYYEWLPLFLGEKYTYQHKLLYKTHDYVNDYDPRVNPTVLNEHSTAAFRYFHTNIAGYLDLVDEQRQYNPTETIRLSDHFNRPRVIEEDGNLDKLIRGMASQPMKETDQFFDKEITEFLFRNSFPLGLDLRAIDIQRNRDHGLASYNEARRHCGLRKARTWADFTDVICKENVNKLAQLYESPDDVDLTVGGALETHVVGTEAGPTFLCILLEQFYRTRVGDRFWYENGDPEVAFNIEQLNEIRKTSISRIFCDNGDDISHMQPSGFEQVSHKNPVVRCSELPAPDLSLWKDYAPHTSSQHNFAFPYFKK